MDLFKTADGGVTWMLLASFDHWVNQLAIDPKNSSILYAASGSDSRISKSVDGGVTWTGSEAPVVSSGDDDFWINVSSLAVDPRDSNVIYATGSGGFFRSTDGGAAWSVVNGG
jgi:photosystem II stability/assembly factor-like uncharacterized protein